MGLQHPLPIRVVASGAALVGLCVIASAQEPLTAPLASQSVATPVDSGFVFNEGTSAETVFTTTITVPDSGWLRLDFDLVLLAGDVSDDTASHLVITSLRDGAVQIMNAEHVAQWQNTSAYFNGDAVTLELIASPNSGPNRLIISNTTAGLQLPAPHSICGSVDDRLPSNDPRTGRIVPIGCTGWMIDDANHCFLTAGHCSGGADVVQFNVPLSNPNGSINNPPPEDQYAVDPASLQSNGGQGIGNDWAYFGCFPNSNTNLTPFEAQGDFFVLDDTPPTVAGQTIRITGYGTTSSPISPTWNQIQKTHTGPYETFSGTTLQYSVDTTGGNSGSPVINEDTGEALGIHTHAGCNTSGGNHGTGANHAGLQNALANPQGVCLPLVITFSYPNGRPELIDPAGGSTLRVLINAETATPQPGTGLLHVDDGQGFVAFPMQEVSPNEYDAVFPASECRSIVNYFVSAETTQGQQISDPFDAPTSTFEVIAAAGVNTLVAFDFEAAPGWTVQNVDLATGAWDRGVPIGGGDRGDPPSDADGSGQCFLTENVDGDSDVDGGPTRLISPVVDLSSAIEPTLRYARWFTNDDGDADRLVVEVSDNGGGAWVEVESVAGTFGWVMRSVLIADHVELTSQFRVRFSATDNPNDSVTEAGIDAFSIVEFECGGVRCTKGDVNQDNVIDGRDISDFSDTLISGGLPGSLQFCATDMDDDGNLEVGDDLSAFVVCLLGGPCP